MSHGYRQAGGRLEGYLSFAHANASPPAPRREQHPGGRGAGGAAKPARPRLGGAVAYNKVTAARTARRWRVDAALAAPRT